MHDGHDFDGFLIIYRSMFFFVLVTGYPKGPCTGSTMDTIS